MVDQNKINQVYAAILENGMDAFTDNDLIKLFSILNRISKTLSMFSKFLKFNK